MPKTIQITVQNEFYRQKAIPIPQVSSAKNVLVFLKHRPATFRKVILRENIQISSNFCIIIGVMPKIVSLNDIRLQMQEMLNNRCM